MRKLFLASAVALSLGITLPAVAQVPNLESIARQTFDSRPADVVALRQLCDQTDALRAQYGEDDARVQDGEMRANAIKGMFTRRIAYAVHQIDPRFGLRRKDAGAHAVRPNDGLSLATDVVLWRDSGQVIDVMSDRNASWGMTPGDVQPLSQWVDPLPELNDAPTPTPVPVPMPLPVPQPVPAPVVGQNYTALLEQMLSTQNALLLTQNELLAISKDTNTHVVNIDHTFTQTLGHFSAFVGKYIAPAVAGFLAAHQLGK